MRRYSANILALLVLVALHGCVQPAWQTAPSAPTRRVEPISAPPAQQEEPPIRTKPLRYAEGPQDESAGSDDAQIAQIDERIRQYAGQVPASDLERKVTPAEPPAVESAAVGSPAVPAPAVESPGVRPVEPAPPVPDRPTERAVKPGADLPTATPAVPGVDPSSVLQANQPVSTAAPVQDPSASPGSTADGPWIEIVDVRPAPAAAVEASPSLAAANLAVPQATSRPAGESLTDLIAQLERQVAEQPGDLEAQFRLRLLYVATDAGDKAAAPLPDLDPVQGQLLASAFAALTAVQQTLRQADGADRQALAASAELHRLIGEQSPVVITRAVLVTRVESFGRYEAVQPLRFAAGRGVHAFCYTELSNYRSQPTPDGRLRTLLNARLEVFDAQGRIIWQRAYPQIEDLSFSPRRDFFVPLELRMPAETPTGSYVLKVTVEDALGATTDQQRISFAIEP